MPNQKDPCGQSVSLKVYCIPVKNRSVLHAIPYLTQQSRIHLLSVRHDCCYGPWICVTMADTAQDQKRSLSAVKHAKGSAHDPPAPFPRLVQEHSDIVVPEPAPSQRWDTPKSREIPCQTDSVRVSKKHSIENCWKTLFKSPSQWNSKVVSANICLAIPTEDRPKGHWKTKSKIKRNQPISQRKHTILTILRSP